MINKYFIGAVLVGITAVAGGGYYYLHPCITPGYLCERAEMAAARAEDEKNPRFITFQPAWLNQPAQILYPAYAINKKMEGSAVVSLVVDAEGKLIERKLKSSSGNELLDEAALAAAERFDFNVSGFGEVNFPYTKELKITFKI